jgi:hypothetical protein
MRCFIANCEREIWDEAPALKLCSGHYTRLRRKLAEKPKPKRKSPMEFFELMGDEYQEAARSLIGSANVRAYGQQWVQVNTRVPPHVAQALERVAMVKDSSMFEEARGILEAWYEQYRSALADVTAAAPVAKNNKPHKGKG